MGYPTNSETCGLPQGGCYQDYQGGAIIWSPATGAQPTWGPTRARGGALNFVEGPMRYPTGDVTRERVKAGIAQARRRGTRHGRPPIVGHYVEEVQRLAAAGLSKSAIAKRVGISRATVRRCLEVAMRLLS